jgi:hypothetical protein
MKLQLARRDLLWLVVVASLACGCGKRHVAPQGEAIVILSGATWSAKSVSAVNRRLTALRDRPPLPDAESPFILRGDGEERLELRDVPDFDDFVAQARKIKEGKVTGVDKARRVIWMEVFYQR